MARRFSKRNGKARDRRRRKSRLRTLVPGVRARARWVRVWRRAPLFIRTLLGLAVVVTVWLAVNWAYQVTRKPSELLFPISESFYKQPAETWMAYGRLFERHSTDLITPDFLAALAQVEGSGNPVVRTYWRWVFTAQLFEIFRPASSAVGMYQITNGTFAEARRYCIHDHHVVTVGPWYDFRSCWFNGLYTRTVPSHAVELTSAYLDRGVSALVQRYGLQESSLPQRQALAATMHLCGAGVAAEYARRGFAFARGRRCGSHDPRDYVARVASMQRVFIELAAAARRG